MKSFRADQLRTIYEEMFTKLRIKTPAQKLSKRRSTKGVKNWACKPHSAKARLRPPSMQESVMELVNLKTGTDSFVGEDGKPETAIIIRGVCASRWTTKLCNVSA
jgi:hypothetical protein